MMVFARKRFARPSEVSDCLSVELLNFMEISVSPVFSVPTGWVGGG